MEKIFRIFMTTCTGWVILKKDSVLLLKSNGERIL
jgi:hypothetical protein